jgi:glycosyltransferase involved in cell wall biosynthesis
MLVFPSKYEGFGLPPLEAMACNCPSIVSDIEVFKELYQNSVIYTPVNDPFALSQNIKNCLNDNSKFEVIKQEFPSTLEKFT